jgi:hypothetical protein
MVRSVTPAGRVAGPRFRGGWIGALGSLGLLFPALVLIAWFAVHHISGLAPWLADGLRGVIGIEGVARLEEFVYGLEDRFYSVWRRGEKPRAYWAVPSEPRHPAPHGVSAPAAPLPALPAGAAALVGPLPLTADTREPDSTPEVELPPFRPSDIGPMFTDLDAPGDGQWVVLPDGTVLDDARMFKTLLHPDAERAWAELFVVALDLRRVRLHLVAGTLEPQSTLPEALDVARPGRVPDELHDGVLAAFNGGFKTEHGHYGMFVNGVLLVPPVDGMCTIVMTKEGVLRIGTWNKLREQTSDALWWRQTPDCMYENGKINQRLSGGYARKWGSSIDGETVIRRSAIGLDPTGNVLFVGISNHTTAPAIARGMHHAGAATVAQLDINFSYPKFVTYQRAQMSQLKLAVPLAEGFEYSENEYLRKASHRDFFFVMDSSMDGRTARN